MRHARAATNRQALPGTRHAHAHSPTTHKRARALHPTRALCTEETNTRVAWFSIFSLAVCVASAGAQLLYLRKFFQRKKLL